MIKYCEELLFLNLDHEKTEGLRENSFKGLNKKMVSMMQREQNSVELFQWLRGI